MSSQNNNTRQKAKNTAFYLGMGTLFTHELDAMTNQEWRVLPLTSWLSDELGMLVFVLLHIPLFAVLIALVASDNQKIKRRSQLAIAIFLVVHSMLHFLYMNHANYEFSSMLSNTLIFGAALLGIIYLLLEYQDRKLKT